MYDLFKAELLRFRSWAVSLAVAHMGWLIFLDRVADPLQQPLQIYQVYGGLLAIFGLLFGAFQMSAYARPTAWIDLLHRPLAPWRIGSMLLASGLFLSALTVALPTVLLLLFHRAIGEGVESRHLLLPLAGWAIAGTGYCVGAHLRLGPPRLAWATVLLLVWLYKTQAYGPGAVLTQLTALVIALLLVLGDFRPDRNRQRHDWRTCADTLIAGFAIGIAGIFALRFAIQLAMMLLGTHPLNGVPPAGGLVEAVRADGQSLITRGLDRSDARQRFWAEQAALSDIVTVIPELHDISPRYSLANPGDNVIEDKEAHLQWSFDHDTMRYVATDQRTRSFWSGQAPPPPLPTPPMADSDGSMIVADNKVLRYDRASHRFVDRITLPAGERILTPPQPAWDGMVLLSDHALRLYDERVMRLGDGRLPAHVQIALPGKAADLARIDVLELLDGYLVSFTFGTRVPEGFGEAEQDFWYVEAGRSQHVALRQLDPDYPALMRYLDVWFAPVIAAAGRQAEQWLAAPNLMDEPGPRGIPAWVFGLALALHAAASFIGWRFARESGLSRRARAGWSIACLALGPALTAALYLTYNRRASC